VIEIPPSDRRISRLHPHASTKKCVRGKEIEGKKKKELLLSRDWNLHQTKKNPIRGGEKKTYPHFREPLEKKEK